jgi:hypothetical protein
MVGFLLLCLITGGYFQDFSIHFPGMMTRTQAEKQGLFYLLGGDTMAQRAR